MSLAEYLNLSLERHYPSIIPMPSPPDELGKYHVELVREQAAVHLAAGVRSHAAGPAGLAAGMDNGNILIWSDWPCPALTLPQASPVDLLAWDGTSPFLGASDKQRTSLHVFDLRLCAGISSVASEEPISVAALSDSGVWVALVDQGRRLQVGPVDNGALRQAGVLRFQPLALGFSPREGLLFSVDQAGWLVHWTLPELLVMDQVLIPNGPFVQAMFSGQHLLLEPLQREASSVLQEDGNNLIVWDIPSANILSSKTSPSLDVHLEAGLLIHASSEKRWIRKMRLGRPRPQVWASLSSNRLRIRDVDGVLRCYCAVDGLPLLDEDCQAEDWTGIELSESGRFHWAGAGYSLADPVMIQDEHVLLCRHLPEERFILWWTKSRLEEESIHVPGSDLLGQGRLPVRESLRMEIPPAWQAVPFQQHDIPGGNQ